MNISCGNWRASLIMGIAKWGTLSGQNCPKCASDQVLNDQCLKCGIVVSKYLRVSESASQPVSYVAPASRSHKEYSYSISKETLEYEQRRAKDKQQRMLIGIGILVGIGLIALLVWRILTFNASEYTGMYTNGELIFGLYFPTEGPKWYHAQPNNLKSLGIKDPHDAFFRGEDPDEPEISLAVFVNYIESVPEEISEERKETLLLEGENALKKRMRDAGVRCEIVDSYSHNVGGRYGFIIEAEIDKSGKLYKASILNGYYYNRAYTVFFVGQDQIMSDNEKLIHDLMETFTFKTSVI